jgi:glyoxylase-like metal-dependent hydrolase (beta-lactamase superfamily II)
MEWHMSAQPNWFERETISSKINRVWEPHVHPFFRANIFHIIGRDADLVMDFGMGIHSLSRFLDIPESKPVIAVATHVHVDHVGSFHEFQYRLGHVVEAEAFASMSDDVTLAAYFRTQPEGVDLTPTDVWNQRNYQIAAAPLTENLREGSRVEIGDMRFTVLHLPGHSPGSIGLLNEIDGLLFSGDAIYEGKLVDDLPGCDKTAYRSTMMRLMELEISAAHGGHGNAMTQERMWQIAASYLDPAG